VRVVLASRGCSCERDGGGCSFSLIQLLLLRMELVELDEESGCAVAADGLNGVAFVFEFELEEEE
jgi:hypothetical protein